MSIPATVQQNRKIDHQESVQKMRAKDIMIKIVNLPYSSINTFIDATFPDRAAA
tara:strand:- start:1646 stop:1807 length:162 start_codon:yes stop_codon:yes gene_type:complete